MAALNLNHNHNPSALIPPPSQAQVDRGYGAGTNPRAQPEAPVVTDFGARPAHPTDTLLPAEQSTAHNIQNNNNDNNDNDNNNNNNSSSRFNEEWDASQRGSSIIDRPMQRSGSVMSQGDTLIPSRGGTLKKKASVRRTGSLKRSSSRRSSRAGSVRSLVLQPGDGDETQSAFYSPVPTSGNPTEILANRFQAWRKVLKDLITYFREIQSSYEHRTKAILKVANIINNTTAPTMFLQSGGIDDAAQVLRNYHKNSVAESNKAKDNILSDVILALTGLRSDLNQKIKEIKSLSGDFKNSVDKEMENTRRAVNDLQNGLGRFEVDETAVTGKKDPYLLKLAADRQVEKQIDEENYLHQAYLNIEVSGRELEAIVVGEIQKSYNAYAGILKREADAAYSTVDDLRTGPIAMPKDHEWLNFIQTDDHFVDPSIPIRQAQNIHYPGRDDELAQEVRAGLLERKSKYLKSYSAGWYVLSPTHLHEFKSADKAQAPIMSLYLPEQKLGSHSNQGSSSNKFMLKGRQTGSMHRGHSWVFRAESYDTMQAWYDDIKILTEKSPQERNAFVRQHARSVSGASQRPGSIGGSSDGIMDDEDEEPFSAANSAVVIPGPQQETLPRRPAAGGRFPSLSGESLSQRGLQAPLSPSSESSNFEDRNVVAAASLPGSGVGETYGTRDTQSPTHAAIVSKQAQADGINPWTARPIGHNVLNNHRSEGHDLPELATAGVGGVAAGALGTEAYRRHQDRKTADEYRRQQEAQAAHEAAMMAAPDTYEQHSAQRAANEAAAVAAPDTSEQQSAQYAATEAAVIAAPDTHMSGGRSQGDLSSDAYPEQSQNVPNPLEMISRPALGGGETHASIQTVSQLHVPGEFPKDKKPAGANLGAKLPV